MLSRQNLTYAALLGGLALTIYYTFSSENPSLYAEAAPAETGKNYILCQFFRFAAYCTSPSASGMEYFSECVEECDDISVLAERNAQLFFTSSNMFTTPHVDPSFVESMTKQMLGSSIGIDPKLATIKVTGCFSDCISMFNSAVLRPITQEGMKAFYQRVGLSLNT